MTYNEKRFVLHTPRIVRDRTIQDAERYGRVVKSLDLRHTSPGFDNRLHWSLGGDEY